MGSRPVPVSTETFTFQEAIVPTSSSEHHNPHPPVHSSILVTPVNNNNNNKNSPNIPLFVGSEVDTITAPVEREDSRRQTLRGKLVTNNNRKLDSKVLGERRKLFGQRTSYY